MIKKIIFSLVALLLTVSTVQAAGTLYEYYNNNLPPVSERPYEEAGIYGATGTAVENTALLGYLQGDMFGAAQRPSNYKTTLAEQLDATASTTEDITVASLNTRDGHTLVDGDVGDFIIITIAPGRGNEEKVKCTEGTDSSATWQNCTRGYSYYTQGTGGTVYSHGPGETVIISDDDAYISTQLGLVDSANTWLGTNTFASSTDDGTQNIWFGTSTPARFENQAGILYYCNNSASCAAIGAGANTYSFILPLTTSGTEVKIATTTANLDFAFDANSKFVLNTTTSSRSDQFWDTKYNASTTKALLTISDNFLVRGNSTTTGSLAVVGDVFGVDKQVRTMTCGEVITANQAVYTAATSSRVLLADADDATSTVMFVGIALAPCDADTNTTAYVQVGGIYTNAGASYTQNALQYLSNTMGALGETMGTVEGIVGRAISSTQVDLDYNKGWQYLGNAVDVTDIINVSPLARYAVINMSCSESGGGTTHTAPVTIFRNGLTNPGLREAGIGGAGSIDVACEASWVSNTITLSFSSDAESVAGTAYFYW